MEKNIKKQTKNKKKTSVKHIRLIGGCVNKTQSGGHTTVLAVVRTLSPLAGTNPNGGYRPPINLGGLKTTHCALGADAWRTTQN